LFQLPPLSFESGLKTEVITLFGETLMRIRTSILLQVAFQLEAGINTTGYSVSVFALVNILRFDPLHFFMFSQFHKAPKKEKLWDYFARLVSWYIKRFVCHCWAFWSTICSVSKVTKSE